MFRHRRTTSSDGNPVPSSQQLSAVLVLEDATTAHRGEATVATLEAKLRCHRGKGRGKGKLWIVEVSRANAHHLVRPAPAVDARGIGIRAFWQFFMYNGTCKYP